MWKDKLKEIIYILEHSDVNEIEVKFWGRSFRVSKLTGMVQSIGTSQAPQIQVPTPPPVPQAIITEESAPEQAAGESVLSPMPGTFYSAPSPDESPFVKEGDLVKKGQTLCIIEAMKIMNEIESEMNGTIIKILIEDAGAVEFNQPLFIINPT